MVVKFTCEYNGKNFHGFQRQKNLRTVQSILEEALSKFFGELIKIAGSGRTDAGVHARGQVCSFQIKAINTNPKDIFKLNTAINAFLPSDVSVRGFEIMNDDFHAQFNAKSKTYIYRCYVSQHRSALRMHNYLQLYQMPDIDKMIDAVKTFIGTQSFKEFTTDKKDSKDFIRTIYSFEIKQEPNNELHFVIKGNGFMRNMVRLLCGRVLDVGLGIAAPKPRTLPAHGLLLDSVEY